jgi:hypothetical protein
MENSLGKRLWTCRKTDYGMNDYKFKKTATFQDFAEAQLRRRLVLGNRRFGTTYHSHFKGGDRLFLKVLNQPPTNTVLHPRRAKASQKLIFPSRNCTDIFQGDIIKRWMYVVI